MTAIEKKAINRSRVDDWHSVQGHRSQSRPRGNIGRQFEVRIQAFQRARKVLNWPRLYRFVQARKLNCTRHAEAINKRCHAQMRFIVNNRLTRQKADVLARQGDGVAFHRAYSMAADIAFHSAIYKASGNHMLTYLGGNIAEVMFRQVRDIS